MALRIGHISDLHFSPPGVPGLREFLSGAWGGALNLRLTRRHRLGAEVIEAAVRLLRRLSLDHVVVTGDLTNLSSVPEFQAVLEMLSPLGGAESLTVVPGNHDVYTSQAARQKLFEKYFGHFLWRGGNGDWPVTKDLGEVALVALNSARLEPPGLARGYLGLAQIRAMEELCERFRRQGKTVVLALHHNLHHRPLWKEITARLIDRWELIRAAERTGVFAILHGHDHRFRQGMVGGRTGTPVRCLACGSLTLPCGSHNPTVCTYEFSDGLLETEVWRYNDKVREFEKEKRLASGA